MLYRLLRLIGLQRIQRGRVLDPEKIEWEELPRAYRESKITAFLQFRRERNMPMECSACEGEGELKMQVEKTPDGQAKSTNIIDGCEKCEGWLQEKADPENNYHRAQAENMIRQSFPIYMDPEESKNIATITSKNQKENEQGND